MLKHSRKFKLVPVEEDEDKINIQSLDPSPPVPPVLTKLTLLDREMKKVMDDSSLGEAERMARYEALLLKWGRFYRQYQAADSGDINNVSNISNTKNNNNNSSLSDTWDSTPKNTLFDRTPFQFPNRFRSRSPQPSAETRTSSPSPTPISPSLTSSTPNFDLYATPSTSRKRQNRKKKTKQQKEMTPPQQIRYSKRLLTRGNQVGSSWLQWRL